MRHRGLLCSYFLIATALFLTGFSIISAPFPVVFILLLALFTVPIIYAVTGDVHPTLSLSYVICTALIPMLLIIDPVKIGLWGHDVYIFSGEALSQVRTGNLSAAIQDGSYPGVYLLVDVVQKMLGTAIEPVTKYVPLITLSVPLFIYVTARRRLNPSSALLISVIAASTRTLLTFETKFVDEILAVSLALLLVFYLPVAKTSAQQVVAVAVGWILVLSHHATSFLIILGFVLWTLSPMLLQSLGNLPIVGCVPRAFVSERQSAEVSIPILIIFGALSVVVPLYSGQNFLGLVLTKFFSSLSGDTSSLSGGGVNTAPGGILTLLSALLTVSLVVLTVYAIIQVYRNPNENWEVGWLFYIGVLGVLYATTLAAGRVVPLDPIRLLIFIVPLLAVVSVAQLRHSQSSWQTIGKLAIALLLIVPNLAAVPPHLLVSDIEKPPLAEGHFTEQQWATSKWASTSNPDKIAALEQDLWAATDTEQVQRIYATCEDSTFEARGGLQQPRATDSVIYSNGAVQLWQCAPS